MAYGKLKADSIIYDDSGSDVEKTIASLASAASTASPTFTGDVTLTGAANNVVFDASDNALEFADNAKATFGTGADLQLWHDGSNSYIKDGGTGDLIIRASDQLKIQETDNGETMAVFNKDGAVNLYHNNVNKFETTANGITISGSVTDSKGDVRDVQVNAQGGTHTLVATDAGSCIKASGNVTVPNSVFSQANVVSVINNTSGDLSIIQGSGVTMYNTADAATGNRTLATRGMATMIFDSASVCYISGSGLS